MKLGIIGGGYVGTATSLFRSSEIQVIIYDIDPQKRSPLTTTLEEIIRCDLIFVCVPTPCRKDGACDTSIVETVVRQLLTLDPHLETIVIRSTVPPGTSARLGTNFMPEFLTEANWRLDFKNRDTWIFGTVNATIEKRCRNLIEQAVRDGSIISGKTMFVSTTEAELAKYARNCFLATKVAFFNELEEYCLAQGLNYESIRQLVTEDSRIGTSHTEVPGPCGRRGFGGSCFPKDLSALIVDYSQKGIEPVVMRAVQNRNRGDRERKSKL